MKYPLYRVPNPSTPEGLRWGIYRNTFDTYMEDFSQIPQSCLTEKFKNLATNGKATVLDIFSSPHAIRSIHKAYDYLSEFAFKGASMSLYDDREPDEKIMDAARGITHIPGNIGRGSHIDTMHYRLHEDYYLTGSKDDDPISPWPALAQWLGENKIDVIMSRGYGALDYIPEHPLVIVQRLWMMLSPEGGVMTLQIPPYQKLYGSVCILEWLDKLHKQKIQFSYVPSYFSSDFRYFGHAPEQYGLLELVKHDDRNLPALPREHRYVLGESNSFNSL